MPGFTASTPALNTVLLPLFYKVYCSRRLFQYLLCRPPQTLSHYIVPCSRFCSLAESTRSFRQYLLLWQYLVFTVVKVDNLDFLCSASISLLP